MSSAEAHVLALAGLPAMGPRRLAALLDVAEPTAAWDLVVRGGAATEPSVAAVLGAGAARVGNAWRATARGIDPDELWARHRAAGYGMLWRRDRVGGFPAALAADKEPPELLFVDGEVAALDGPRVAVVGTRRCTRYGRDVARTFGRELAAAGVRVVSGLALGIDGAAHEGALEAAAPSAPPVAVVATGLDVVYPRRHAGLWRRVAQAGLVITEAPLGTAPERWRFPARNRIIAALADVVVVVESHAAGGSLITVQEALDRDRPVMAVPGPVRSPASAGTNRLLHDGLPPARDSGDVLVELGLNAEALARGAAAGAAAEAGAAAAGAIGALLAAPTPERDDPLLDALGWEPATLEVLVSRTGRSPAEVAVGLSRLERDGAVSCTGGWWERVA